MNRQVLAGVICGLFVVAMLIAVTSLLSSFMGPAKKPLKLGLLLNGPPPIVLILAASPSTRRSSFCIHLHN